MAEHKALARLNRYTINPLMRLYAARIPPFAIVEHVGRRTGKTYRTPLMAFPTEHQMIIALTYGVETDWIKNVLARGGCLMDYKGQTFELWDPELRHTPPSEQPLPPLIKWMLQLLKVNDFLALNYEEA